MKDPSAFSAETHERMNHAMHRVVSALCEQGWGPCDAIKISNEAMDMCWQIWNDFAVENDRLSKAVMNQCGDNLCWIEGLEAEGKIQPWEQFGESCKRYHSQISGVVGELNAGQMTIAQLEAECERLRRIVDQVDDVLVVNWVGPRKDGDYRKALADLITFNIQIENDPAVSLTAKMRQIELESLRLECKRLRKVINKCEESL